MSLLEAIIQGIVQGVTEFLPVSSSGHLALYQYFTKMEAESTTFVMAVLHLGTLFAVFIAFYQTILELIGEAFAMLRDLLTFKFTLKNMNLNRKMIMMLIVATLPLLILIPFKSVYDGIVQQGNLIVLGACFLFTSTILFLADKKDHGRKAIKEMRYQNALVIGIFQALAILPGISRSGSTISSSLISGFSKEFAVKFSFILGIPAILGGSLIEIKDAMEVGSNIELLPMIAGFLAAAISGFISIKAIAWLVKTDKYKIFAIYTLIVGLVTLVLGII